MPIPVWPIPDTDLPSVNGLAALNHLDLAELQGQATPELVNGVISAVTPEAERNSSAIPSIVSAVLLREAISNR